MDSATCAHMRKIVERVDVKQFHAGGLAYLLRQSDLDVLDEPDTRKGVVEAVGWMADLLGEGVDLKEIAGRIKSAHSSKLLEAAGAHLLSGHVGKGQQFDWVIVIGLEDGNVPNFNATTDDEVREEARVFSVMLSRARHGVAITRSARVPTLAGDVRPKLASPFLEDLREPGVLSSAVQADAWFASVDWGALAVR
jgi:DNA helicase-2/ATP-dependent DNA helicase PcrA